MSLKWGIALSALILLVGTVGPGAAREVIEDRFAQARCDRLAAFDRSGGQPVPLSRLDAAAVLEACGAAVREDAPTRHFVQLARGHLKLGNRRAAAMLLSAASEAGNPAAMFILAQMHHAGHGIGRNLERALDLYQRALERGYRRAAVGLVILYESDASELRDPDQAAELRRDFGLEGRDLPTLP